MGEVFGFGREVLFSECGYRTLLASGGRLVEVMPYTSAEIPPAGAPSGFDGTPQAFALK